MHIPKGHEMELLEESLTDGPGSLDHVAVCKQERLSFAQPLGLVQNGQGEGEGKGEGERQGEGDSSEEPEEQGGQDPPRKKSHTISRQRAFKSKPELQRQGGVSHSREAEFPSSLWHSASAGGPGGAGRGCPVGVSSPSGRQVVGKADSWPHNAVLGQTLSAASKSDACLHTAVDAGDGQPPRELQRRVSQEFDPEKTTRRKIKVYPPESESAIEMPVSRSAECESMFIGTLFDDNDSRNSDFLSSSFSLDTEAAGLDGAEASMVSAAGLEAGLKRSLGLALGTDQEKRRFSASELMNRLQLSQRKMAQALKLPKALSARSPSREKNASSSLTSEGKCSVKEKTRSLTSAECLVFQQLQSSGTLSADSLLRGLEKPLSRSRKEEEDTGETQLRERRHSRFLQNCEFMPAILYQEYSNVASDREIQRQKRADTVTEDEDATAGNRHRLSHHNSIRSQRSSRGSAFVLWQDIPGVRSSGLLDAMGNEQRKLQEAKFELVTSEGSYLCSLTLTVEHFQNSKELQECLNSQEKQWLFSKLPEVKEVSEKFLQELEDRVERDILRFDVCDIVLTHCPAFRRVYLPYVTNQAYQEQTYQRLLQENPKFPGVLAKLEEDPKCQRLPLTSFLILPFQRIMRLKMLVENILKRTAQGSQDEDAALKAFNELKKVTAECNCSVQSMKRTEELIHLNKKIHFESKIFPLISQSRWLVKHGELTEVDTQTNNMSGSKFKLSTKPIYLHLFNDCLLLSRKKDTGKFAVFVHAKIHELKAKDLNVKVHGIPGHVFHLQLFEKDHLKQQILLRARTESEKQRWITATLLTHQETDSDLIEVEKEDSPQVQCIKAYKAQEHDELTLEKADVFQVKTKTKDGWIEGVRLSDGDKGWFPTSHVEEIRNRHARMRNLRDKNRIKCATQKLQGQSS